MARFAMVVVVDDHGHGAEHLWELFTDTLTCQKVDEQQVCFVGEPLSVAELDEYETRALATAIVTHPDLPGGEGYTIHHVAGEGFRLCIGGAEYGPYDCEEQEAIKRAFHDSASG